MAYKLSPNSLKLYTDCPRCFWFDRNQGVERPSLPFPSLPSGMDLAIKRYFDVHREKGSFPVELDCLKNAALYSGPEFSRWRNNSTGLSWSDEEENTLHGAIDDMLVIGNKKKKLSVLDYKTRGFKLKNDTAENYRLPLTIYTFLGRMEGESMSDIAHLAFFHSPNFSDDGRVGFKIDVVPMKVDTRGVKELFYRAISVLESSNPPDSKDSCNYCNWKTSTL